MANTGEDDKLPTWIIVLVGGGLCIPLVLLLALLLTPKPPSAAEQAAAQAEAAAAEQAAQEIQRQRTMRQQLLSRARSGAATEAMIWGGGLGLLLGIITLISTSYVIHDDVWTGVKIGGQHVTETQSRTNYTSGGLLAVLWMPAAGAGLFYIAAFLWYSLQLWFS